MFIPLENPSHVFGDFLKQQVEDRLKFYESGDHPRKNIDVMKEAIQVIYLNLIKNHFRI
jgi:nucleolar protein 56